MQAPGSFCPVPQHRHPARSLAGSRRNACQTGLKTPSWLCSKKKRSKQFLAQGKGYIFQLQSKGEAKEFSRVRDWQLLGGQRKAEGRLGRGQVPSLACHGAGEQVGIALAPANARNPNKKLL